jgi:hypothetical protein
MVHVLYRLSTVIEADELRIKKQAATLRFLNKMVKEAFLDTGPIRSSQSKLDPNHSFSFAFLQWRTCRLALLLLVENRLRTVFVLANEVNSVRRDDNVPWRHIN